MGTVRAHLEAAAKSSKKAAADLIGPAFVHELAYLHEWAVELHIARRWGQSGPVPISYVDLDAWARMTRRSPEPEEVQALFWLTRTMAHPPPEKR